ncbi:MAG TPA: hypothetical protein VIE15_07280, partial [Acidimicrobiales bacterium]
AQGGVGVMFCQWCGKERPVDALAVHHCGAKERPPAYCIGCGHTFEAGATECTACGTPVGQMPKAPVVVQAPETADATTTAVPAAAGSPVAAAAPTPASPAAVAATSASTTGMAKSQRRAPDDVDAYANGLAKVGLWAAVIGTAAFFIDWGFGTGIQLVELVPTHWWNLTSPNFWFALMLVALLLTIATILGADGVGVNAAIAVLGLLMTVIAAEYLWHFRKFLSGFTGFWLVAAAGVALLVAGTLAAMHARDT